MDRKRNLGPEGCVAPFPAHQKTNVSKALMDSEYCRQDKRYPEQLRPITIKAGAVPRANGSAFASCGDTKLFCSVYGPRSTSSRTTNVIGVDGKLTCEINFATFSGNERCSHQPKEQEYDLAQLLLAALAPAIITKKFPNLFVDIYITVVERDGSILSTAINAASVALAQAGIEMMDSVVGCSALIHNDVLLMDPSGAEENFESSGSVDIAFMPNLNQVTQYNMNATRLLSENVNDTLSTLIDACHFLYESVHQPTLDSIIQEFEKTRK